MRGNVLIVDDSLTVRMDLAQAFSEAGFAPIVCATASEARAAMARGPVNLAILDVLLPDGDGIELLKEIRHSPAISKAAVLMLSSESEVRDRIRGLETGADDYVGKPYNTSHVIARARELLGADDAPGGAAGTLSVLVIDDSPTFREGLSETLEDAGYSVLSAASGEEGLRMAAASRPDAVIVDSVMPGIDGDTVVRHLRLDAALRGVPCLLLTAAEDRNAELRALDSGADAFVRKTEDLEMILARLAALLRSAGKDKAKTASLLSPKRVLAVDDSLTYLNELAAELRVQGYDPILAHSGEEAIAMLAAQPVECILLDLIMPGMSGKETCQAIKASPKFREIPLIIITALEDRSAMIDGLTTGADDYIAKSSEFAVLMARVRAQIRRKQFEDEHRKIREDLLRSQLEAVEAKAARDLAEAKAVLAEELERKNKELEAFSYSVSHDLRAPLRSIDGFSQILLEDCADQLDDEGKNHLSRMRAAARRMGELIDDLLELSRVSRVELTRRPVNIAELARATAWELQMRQVGRSVEVAIHKELMAHADERLMRVVLENLIGNAWKFTSKTGEARIEVGMEEQGGDRVFFVRDNGAGFDMKFAERLFSPFQRLHSESDFPGTGIGLATVHRILDRHGGRVWAEGSVGKGATVFFTVPPGLTE